MIRIVIAEDQEMLLEAMGSLLNLEDDMEVVGLAGNGEEALTLIHQLQPDVCLMDIEMPKMTGLEAAEAINSLLCKVIILTTFARPGYFGRALKADVRGYLLKDSPSEELASSIRSIMDGKRIYCPELMDADSSAAKLDDVNEVVNQKGKPIGTVRSYFSTILDKIKLPTG
ncbi:response regulator transcription factor [Neobacillus sp. NPDC097160]|uniref:response regulator n=1 Tax=Neobacillus sp. NPDC097160 TaxID=3364298 RepID=UPI0037F8063B